MAVTVQGADAAVMQLSRAQQHPDKATKHQVTMCKSRLLAALHTAPSSPDICL